MHILQRNCPWAVFALAVLFVAGTATGAFAQPAPVDGLEFVCFGETAGGDGGRVIHVTNYDDGGPGSFREAVTTEGPRTIVFDIGGTFDLERLVVIRHPDVTIDGSSAPDPGVTFRHYGIQVQTSNVVIRHVRVRVGDARKELVEEPAFDGITIFQSRNVWIDHCSVSWAIDEALDVNVSENVTVSNCIFAETLCHSIHPDGAHSMGPLILDSVNVALVGNLIAHCGSRTPKIGSSTAVVANNVIYDPHWQFIEVEDAQKRRDPVVAVVGNVTIPGPSAEGPLGPSVWVNRVGPGARVYLRDNPCRTGDCTRVEVDDSTGVFVASPPVWCASLVPLPAAHVEAYVRGRAGAFPRDAIDTRVVEEVRVRTGQIIDSQSQVPDGWR